MRRAPSAVAIEVARAVLELGRVGPTFSYNVDCLLELAALVTPVHGGFVAVPVELV